MLKEFDKEFKQLVNEDVPMVVLEESHLKKQQDKKEKSDNVFVQKYCEEY